jgi:hypothetical protein
MKTDDVLSRMHTTLYAMATDPSLLNPVESAEISNHLQRLQTLLYAVVAARASTPDHLSQLETSYRTLLSYYGRLEVRILSLEPVASVLTRVSARFLLRFATWRLESTSSRSSTTSRSKRASIFTTRPSSSRTTLEPHTLSNARAFIKARKN